MHNYYRTNINYNNKMENLILNRDTRSEIFPYLTERDKNMLLSVNKSMCEIKYIIKFDTKILSSGIDLKIKYLDSFTNVVIFNLKHLKLFNSIRHLTFDHYFNKSILGAIPNSVQHLTFGHYFNQPILGAIPNSVKYLTFYHYFNRPILGAIPPSVTHLTFGYYFNQSILGAIPPSVIHLTFHKKFDLFRKHDVPSTVKNLIIG